MMFEGLLQHEWGLKIGNAVELTELAVSVLGRPSLATFGVKKLANFLEVRRLGQRALKIPKKLVYNPILAGHPLRRATWRIFIG